MAPVGEFELNEGPDYAWLQVVTHLEARIEAGELPAAPACREKGNSPPSTESPSGRSAAPCKRCANEAS